MAEQTRKKIIACLLLLAIVAVYFSIPGKKVMITVKTGESAVAVATDLKRNELIYSKNLFLLLVKVTNSSGKIKAGAYEFSKKSNIFKILLDLRSGTNSLIRVTIPEGSNVKQTAEIIAEKIKIDKKKFVKIANDRKLEGYLMPETYLIDPAMNEEAVINMMRAEFDKKVTQDMYERAKEIKMPMKDIIILASIIEKEAVKPEERTTISAVFYNRIKKRIKLESCATVLYAMDTNKAHLSIEDTKFDSPYNTYRIYGLPPGPICSPGIASIRAALYPANSSSLFFVSAGNGKHLFADTLDGHIKNKQLVKQKKK